MCIECFDSRNDMKSNRFPFSFRFIRANQRNEMKHIYTHIFRLRCKNETTDDESRIDMCINAIEIVHAFTGINATAAAVAVTVFSGYGRF